MSFPRSYLSRPGRRTRNWSHNMDPTRYFILLYTVQAVCDYLWPPYGLTRRDYHTAREFVHSEDGQALISYFGIPMARINPILNTVTEVRNGH